MDSSAAWTGIQGHHRRIEEVSREVGDDESKIEQVGTISANNDETVGKLIAEAMRVEQRRGITVEEAKGTETK